MRLAQALERMEAAAETDADDASATFVRVVYRSRWFVLVQTEGEATAAVARHFPRSDGIHLDRRRLLHHVDLANGEILVAVTDTVQAEQLDDAS